MTVEHRPSRNEIEAVWEELGVVRFDRDMSNECRLAAEVVRLRHRLAAADPDDPPERDASLSGLVQAMKFDLGRAVTGADVESVARRALGVLRDRKGQCS